MIYGLIVGLLILGPLLVLGGANLLRVILEKAGHPSGLAILFLTEVWERLSYYGMRALLVLYMVEAMTGGGFGFANAKATQIYGYYTSAVYLTAIPGGWIADNILGAKNAVILGGIIIALGQFTLAAPSPEVFYLGLFLIIIGTGFLKPNISAMVGALYKQGDVRRDAGFSIFYMGINLGALLAPLTCGFVAQDPRFKAWLIQSGVDPHTCWRWAFAVAGFGMSLGVMQFLFGRKYLEAVGNRPIGKSASAEAVANAKSQQPEGYDKPITREDYKRLGAVIIFCTFAVLFWAVFEQAGSSLTLFADQMTNNQVLGIPYPSSYYQSVNPFFIIALTPLFAWMWVKWGEKQPSTPLKFGIGLFFVGVGFVVAAYASSIAGSTNAKVAAWWLIAVYFIHTVGELCLSPVGLSTMTKLAHPKLVGMVMGIWFLAPAIGNFIGGFVAGYFDAKDPAIVVKLFGILGCVAIGGGVVMALLTPVIRKLMGNVR
ncbi:MAG: peptide MFS transporter [Acidobacteria bacterium]|nr:peptide MFS transporter [Acidobacteriota bacterium]